MDDFGGYNAITWIAHARTRRVPATSCSSPACSEHGVSTARVVYAFNSANVEGWALYTEAEMKQYEPPRAQICTLQMRLMRRCARDARSDAQSRDDRTRRRQAIPDQQAVLSEPMAKQEVDRYTFREARPGDGAIFTATRSCRRCAPRRRWRLATSSISWRFTTTSRTRIAAASICLPKP